MWDAIWNDEMPTRDDEIEREVIDTDDDDTPADDDAVDALDAVEMTLDEWMEIAQ